MSQGTSHAGGRQHHVRCVCVYVCVGGRVGGYALGSIMRDMSVCLCVEGGGGVLGYV